MAASKKTEATSVRLTPELAARVDAIADVMAERAVGVRIGRPTVIALAVERGLPALEAELGIGKKSRGKRK